MKNIYIFRKPICLFLAAFFVMHVGWGQTYYNMSSGNYSQTFSNLSTSYPTNFNGLAVLSTGSIPVATKTTTTTNVALGVTSSSTGIAYDAISSNSTKMIFLSTGTPDNSVAVACDLNLNFTGRTAGSLSFNYANILNSSVSSPNGRSASLNVYYSTDGTTWTLLGGPYTVYNNTGASTANIPVNITLPTALDNQSTVKIRFYEYNGGAVLGSPSGSRPKISLDDILVTSTSSGALTPPTLTSASSPTVDAPFNVTFTDDPTWRGAITSITVGGTTLSASAYSISAGQITFTPSASTLLQSAGSKSIVVIATGYSNSTVSQSIGAGIANKLRITTQPTAPSINGGTLAIQPRIAIQDQYGNATTSTASINAALGAGTWTLGGTTSVNAISGTTTFAGLTATSTNAVSGATITFTSTGLTSVTSNTFNISAPAPSNDLCNNSTTLTNGAPTSGTTISATYNIINSDPYNYSSDVWYSYTSVSSGTISVSLSNSASIDYDLFAYTSNCPTNGIGIQTGGNSNNSTTETMTITASPGTTYYFRVAAYNNVSGSVFTISVNQPLAPPSISSPNNVMCNSFDANWSSVNNATNYRLDVSTSNFTSSTNTQGFSSGTTPPSGWTYTAIGGTYTSSGNFGSSSPSLQMDATNDRVLTLTYSGIATQLSFWYKGQTATGSSLLVEGYNGTSWITIQNITSLSSSGTTVTYNSTSSPTLPANLNQFRFTYIKSSGNLSFDDVSVILENVNYLSGYQDLSVSSNSKSISGLSPNTKYYYRVRSTDGTSTSAHSNIDSITTPALSLTTDGIIVPFCFGTATSSSLTYTAANDNPNSYSIDWNATANSAGLNDQAATSFTASASGGTISSIAISSNLAAGTYNGVMTITNTAGCSITKNVSLTINPLPTITIAASPSSAIVCTGSNVSLTASGASTYSWSGGISNGSSFSVTTPTSYTVTGTDANGCSATASKTVNYYPASSNVVLASSSVSGAVEQCTESDGYTYYADPALPGQYLFGINKNGNSFSATVDINVDNVNKFNKSTSSNGANQEHASYILSRFWNVNATGTINNPVKVRFFIEPQDISDLLDARDDDLDTLKINNPSTKAVISGFEWFKTSGISYNPSIWNGNKFNSTLVKLTQDTVSTINGQWYVELSGITSFSGGTGGAAFGPSSNNLFNSGGIVGLPVTWKEVNASAKEIGNQIQWITSSEKNTSHFEVEYSYDAKNFMTASRDIKAAGNSTTSNSYEYTHLEEFGEMVYYRIKQIDRDEKIDYSKIVNVKRSSKLPEFQVSMYPIPLNTNELNLKIQTVQKTEIVININDLLGRSVFTEKVNPQGYITNHKLTLDHLQKGTYQVMIDNGINKSVQILVVGK